MKTILLVCTGNLCRSPMATVLLRDRLARLGLSGEAQVESAGIWAAAGLPASEMARRLMAEKGLPMDEHRSRPMTEDMLRRADLVLVMEEAQRRFLFHLSMRDLHKVFLLAELSGGHADIPDPYGGSREDYVASARVLERLIDAGLPRILKLLDLEPARNTG